MKLRKSYDKKIGIWNTRKNYLYHAKEIEREKEGETE